MKVTGQIEVEIRLKTCQFINVLEKLWETSKGISKKKKRTKNTTEIL